MTFLYMNIVFYDYVLFCLVGELDFYIVLTGEVIVEVPGTKHVHYRCEHCYFNFMM